MRRIRRSYSGIILIINTIPPFIMRRILSTVLLACLVLGAWAQNKKKMTEEEKKETMEQLEVFYQFETGTAFSGLDSLAENQEFKQDMLPWENGRTNSSTRALKRVCQDYSCALTRHS